MPSEAKANQAAVYEAIKDEVRGRVDALVKVAVDLHLERMVKEQVAKAVRAQLGTCRVERSVQKHMDAVTNQLVQRFMAHVKISMPDEGTQPQQARPKQ